MDGFISVPTLSSFAIPWSIGRALTAFNLLLMRDWKHLRWTPSFLLGEPRGCLS
jgi:hypothetical protein